MPVAQPKLKICPQGHRYYKSSDCPTCPHCEEERKPTEGFLAGLAAPARRALESVGVDTVEKLAKYSAGEILALHGMGKSSLPKLEAALKVKGLTFRKK